MKRTVPFAFSITAALLTVTSLIGVVQAKSLPTPTVMTKVTGGNVVATATVTAAWVRSPATSLMVTAKPAKIVVGKSTTLTVTIPPNKSDLVPNGEYVQIYDKTTRQRVGNGVYTGSANTIKTKAGNETFSVKNKSTVAGSQTFVADLWDKGVTHQNHKPSQTSNPVAVTWVRPFVTPSSKAKSLMLTTGSTASQVGDTVVLDAAVSNIPNSDCIIIQDVGGRYDLGNGKSATNTVSASTTQTVQYGGIAIVQQTPLPNPKSTRSTSGK